MTSFPLWGPTYAEMRDPRRLAAEVRRQANALRMSDPEHVLNLFNIHWRDAADRLSMFRIPSAVSGVAANILLLDGGSFPSGSLKVGPAYAILMEKELQDGIRPGAVQVIGPSTGNFGIGVAYVCRLKGYRARIVMPQGMSPERYELIRALGGATDLTAGTEADVVLALERTRARYAQRPDCAVLGQFEDMANYRFHRHVTGQAILDGLAAWGLPRVDAFVAAPGSAGTLGAGDALRQRWPDVAIAAVEPKECSTLYDGGGGQHVVEGIGDQMVTLIHNVYATDFVVRVPGAQTLQGMELFNAPAAALASVTGLEADAAARLRGKFGPSGVCNLLGAIKLAKALDFTSERTIVTVATDNHDRYRSVSQAMARRLGGAPDRSCYARWHEAILSLDGADDVLHLRAGGHHERLQAMKKATWTRLGASAVQIDAMEDQRFWDAEYARIPDLDAQWEALRVPPHLS